MKRATVAPLACVCLLAAITVLTGCSGSDSPAGPSTEVYDYYIGGFYYHYPTVPPSRNTDGAWVIVREDSSTGPVVTDVDVRVNGEELSFSQTNGVYTGSVPSVASGNDITFAVSDGIGAVSQSCQVPFAASNLLLSNGGVWNTSSLLSANTITWTNPLAVGQSLGVGVYDYNGVTYTPIYGSEAPSPTVTGLTLYNSQLAYYQGLSSVQIIVYHFNEAPFADNPGDSGIWVGSGLRDLFPAAPLAPSGPPSPLLDTWSGETSAIRHFVETLPLVSSSNHAGE